MKNQELTNLLGAFVAGAAAMYFLDAASGGRRRALVRDKAVRAQHLAMGAVSDVEHDLENRSRGVLARIHRAFARGPVDDEVLVERVRAKLGHVCSHPSAIETKVRAPGCLELRGPILARERLHVLSTLALVPGVRMIDDDLEVHAEGDIPALAGEARHPSFVQRHWNPTTRFLVGAAGVACFARGLLDDGLPRSGRLALGSALIATTLVSSLSPAHAQPVRGGAEIAPTA